VPQTFHGESEWVREASHQALAPHQTSRVML
jgi:hypothetical protein